MEEGRGFAACRRRAGGCPCSVWIIFIIVFLRRHMKLSRRWRRGPSVSVFILWVHAGVRAGWWWRVLWFAEKGKEVGFSPHHRSPRLAPRPACKRIDKNKDDNNNEKKEENQY